MFQSARLKLTFWYLVILMCISLAFSLAIYSVLTQEVRRFAQDQRALFERRMRYGQMPSDLSLSMPLPAVTVDNSLMQSSQRRLAVSLFVINGLILIASGWLSYFLAGRTLSPIQQMLEQHKRFIADASHELRTPLTALRTSLEVALRNPRLRHVPSQQVLQETLLDVVSLQALSEQLLSFGKLEEQGESEEKQRTSTSELFALAVGRVSALAQQKNITLEHTKGAFEVSLQREASLQLLVILLENAIKFSDPGKSVQLSARKHQGYASFSVTDHGYGIDPQDVPHIFERFYQADRSRSKQELKGFGLGLSLARALAEKQGGRLAVKSTLGKGSSFTFLVPLL